MRTRRLWGARSVATRPPASTTGRIADGGDLARIARRRRAGVPSAGGGQSNVLPPSKIRSRAPAAPPDARPGSGCGRTREVLEVLASERFVDRSPAEVIATLLDEGHYLCPERTMYRNLGAENPRVGGLVQQPSDPRADREPASGRGRSGVLSPKRAHGAARMTQGKRSPEYPERFSSTVSVNAKQP